MLHFSPLVKVWDQTMNCIGDIHVQFVVYCHQWGYWSYVKIYRTYTSQHAHQNWREQRKILTHIILHHHLGQHIQEIHWSPLNCTKENNSFHNLLLLPCTHRTTLYSFQNTFIDSLHSYHSLLFAHKLYHHLLPTIMTFTYNPSQPDRPYSQKITQMPLSPSDRSK